MENSIIKIGGKIGFNKIQNKHSWFFFSKTHFDIEWVVYFCWKYWGFCPSFDPLISDIVLILKRFPICNVIKVKPVSTMYAVFVQIWKSLKNLEFVFHQGKLITIQFSSGLLLGTNILFIVSTRIYKLIFNQNILYTWENVPFLQYQINDRIKLRKEEH